MYKLKLQIIIDEMLILRNALNFLNIEKINLIYNLYKLILIITVLYCFEKMHHLQ